MIKYEDCLDIIEKLRFNQESDLFAVERDKGLESIIGNIYQSFAGQDIYKSIEEKGANPKEKEVIIDLVMNFLNE